MVNYKELIVRVKNHLRFNKHELSGILVAILATAFIFSFRDWGAETFNLYEGLTNLAAVLVIAAITVFFRLSCQKIYGLSEGYKAEFKVWWTGIIITLVVAFISLGKLPLLLAGTMVSSFMVKLRLGEFRYGFSYLTNGVIAFWGILGNLILALMFAIGLYFFPESYFFAKGLIINVIMAWCSILPLPQLDGLSIYFASRGLYYITALVVLLASVLLLTQTTAGLIIAIVLGLAGTLIYVLISSEK